MGDGDGVEGELLGDGMPHEAHDLVDQRLVRRQKLQGDVGYPTRQPFDLGVQVVGGDGLHDQADALGGLAVYGVAGHHHALGPLGPDKVCPHVVFDRLDAPYVGEAEGAVLRGYDHVAGSSEVGGAGEAVAVDLGDDGLGEVPELAPLHVGLAKLLELAIEVFGAVAVGAG